MAYVGLIAHIKLHRWFSKNLPTKLKWIVVVSKGKKSRWPIYQRLMEACICLTSGSNRISSWLQRLDKNWLCMAVSKLVSRSVIAWKIDVDLSFTSYHQGNRLMGITLPVLVNECYLCTSKRYQPDNWGSWSNVRVCSNLTAFINLQPPNWAYNGATEMSKKLMLLSHWCVSCNGCSEVINRGQIHLKVWFIHLTMYTNSNKSVQFEHSIWWL